MAQLCSNIGVYLSIVSLLTNLPLTLAWFESLNIPSWFSSILSTVYSIGDLIYRSLFGKDVCEISSVPLPPDRPNIVSREEWKARNATQAYKSLESTPVPYVVIHHGGTNDTCCDKRGCINIVKSYQNQHMDDYRWMDIGYNFVIGEDGNVYQGVGWNHAGFHTRKYNLNSIGICVIGNFTDHLPNKAARKALESLIRYGVEIGKISERYGVFGHEQMKIIRHSRLCPGEVFSNWIKRMQRWIAVPTPIYSDSYFLWSANTTENKVLNDWDQETI